LEDRKFKEFVMVLIETVGALVMIRALHMAFKWNAANRVTPAKKSTGVKVGNTIYGS
jgi:hypothetical protein